MVFLKNTAIRVGHSIIWTGRYSARYADLFNQISFWMLRLVERAFFSRKFKYSSVMYSHTVISGFERNIFLTIFVYDGLLVSLLYTFYRLIAVSKFFRRFSYLFHRRPVSYPALNFQSHLSYTLPVHKLKKKKSPDEESNDLRPYYQTYYSRVSLRFSRFLKRKTFLFGWRFFKRRFSFLRDLQIQASQNFRYKKKIFKNLSFSRRIRFFLRFFFQNFYFFSKFKQFGYSLGQRHSSVSARAMRFITKKIFRNSRAFRFFKSAIFSSFLTEFFSKLFFYTIKSSKITQFSKPFNYAYIRIFFQRTFKSSRGFRIYRKQLMRLVRHRHRVSAIRGRVSFTPLLLFFQQYLKRLKHKYRYYMGNPAFFFNYSSIYFRHKFSYMSRRRKRRLKIFFRKNARGGRYVAPQGLRFFSYRYKQASKRMKHLIIQRRRQYYERLRRRKKRERLMIKSNTQPVKFQRKKSRDLTSLFSPNSRRQTNLPLKRSFTSFVEKFKKLINERKKTSFSSSSDSSKSVLFSSVSSSLNKSASGGLSSSKKKEFAKNLSLKNFKFSNKKFLSFDERKRLLKLAGKKGAARMKYKFKRMQKRFRRHQIQARHRFIRFGSSSKRNKMFRKRRRYIKFNTFNFNNLLVSGLYKHILALFFKRNMLGRTELYNMFNAWLRLSFARLFPYFLLNLRLVLVFPINLRSNILAKYITRKLEFHYTLNELVYPMLKTLRPFFKGFYLRASGRFSRAQRALVRKFSFGKISFSTLGNSLSYVFRWTRLKYGVCSIKLWMLPKTNPFFKKTYYYRQLDKNFRLILFDSFYDKFVFALMQNMLKKLQFFQHILQICVGRQFLDFVLESIKLKFYTFKDKVQKLTTYTTAKGMCTMFVLYSLSFSATSLTSFYFFNVRFQRNFKRLKFRGRRWYFVALSSRRNRTKFRWFAPMQKFNKGIMRFRRRFSFHRIPIKYGTN